MTNRYKIYVLKVHISLIFMFNSDEWCERNEHSNTLRFYANLSVLSDVDMADVNLRDPER